eukprot:2782622-Rhodomonas_salina.1
MDWDVAEQIYSSMGYDSTGHRIAIRAACIVPVPGVLSISQRVHRAIGKVVLPSHQKPRGQMVHDPPGGPRYPGSTIL